MGGKAEEVEGEAGVYERWLLNAVALYISGTLSTDREAAAHVVERPLSCT